MTDVTRSEVVAVPGTTSLAARALQRLAVGVVKDAARVNADDVAVALSDDRGLLRIAVTVPFAVTPGRTSTIVEDGETVRRAMITRMRELAGRTVGAVDLRYSGVRNAVERRVR